MTKRRLSKQQSRRVASRQSRDIHAAGEHGGNAALEQQTGLVIANYGRSVDVEATDGRVFRCHQRANLKIPVAGDQVSWQAEDEGQGVILAISKRHGELQRPDSQGRLRTVAANIDTIVVVFAIEPEPHHNMLDRYLIAAEIAGIKPLLVLNKSDLLNDAGQAAMAEFSQLYRTIGYQVETASATTQGGTERLSQLLQGQTSVFVGQSGVGKSSLISAILPDQDLRIGALSSGALKGRHTTTARLYHLPTGGCIVDSPGIREFALYHLENHEIAPGFAEFRPWIQECRFRDCNHLNAPGCALISAMEQGKISERRYQSYCQIINDNNTAN